MNGFNANIENVVSIIDIGSPRGFTLDVKNRKIFWSDFSQNAIFSASMDDLNSSITKVKDVDTPGELIVMTKI